MDDFRHGRSRGQAQRVGSVPASSPTTSTQNGRRGTPSASSSVRSSITCSPCGGCGLARRSTSSTGSSRLSDSVCLCCGVAISMISRRQVPQFKETVPRGSDRGHQNIVDPEHPKLLRTGCRMRTTTRSETRVHQPVFGDARAPCFGDAITGRVAERVRDVTFCWFPWLEAGWLIRAGFQGWSRRWEQPPGERVREMRRTTLSGAAADRWGSDWG